MYERLKMELDIINMFIVHIDNVVLTNKWYFINDKYTFRVNNGFIRSKQDVIKNMFDLYTYFIEQLNIELKMNYINVYEKETGNPWKQLYITSKETEVKDTDKDYVNLKWYSNKECELFGRYSN